MEINSLLICLDYVSPVEEMVIVYDSSREVRLKHNNDYMISLHLHNGGEISYEMTVKIYV